MNELEWHRTFLPDGPFDCANCHAPNVNPQMRTTGMAGTPFPDSPFYTVKVKAPPRRPYSPAQKRYHALKFTGKDVTDVYIVANLSQEFQAYATDWEKRFSYLAGGAGTVPVVDESLTVIGHIWDSRSKGDIYIGGVRRGDSAYNDNPKEPWLYKEELTRVIEMLDGDFPMYVDLDFPPGPWFRFVQMLAPIYDYKAFCAVDGQVIQIYGLDGRAGAISVDPPWDYVLMAKELVMLGAGVGAKIIRTAMRATKNLQKRVLRGAERKLAEAAAARAAKKGAAAAVRREAAGSTGFIPQSGMTKSHFEAFRAAAQEEKVIVLVRNTNPKSTVLIERGAPGKPKDLEFLKTSADDGIVTVSKPTDLLEVYDKGYFVVGNDKVARRLVKGDPRSGTAVYEELHLKDAFWQVKPGQVIESQSKMPIVGDYDLMGVIPVRSPGQNIALVANEGKMLTDWTNPATQKFARAVNAKMDRKRVLHGAQDAYGGFRGPVVGFFPDGTVRHFETQEAVEKFYQSIGRQPRTGSYGAAGGAPPPGGSYPPLRVAGRKGS